MNRRPVYILAGGRGSRFGGDKARAMVHDQPMLTRVARMIEPIAQSITVVAEREGKYDDLNLRTIADDQPDLGPIGGLATALRDHGDGWIVILSCDLLTVEPRWFDRLWAKRTDACRSIAFRHARWEPLLALYHTDLLPTVRAQITQNRLAMRALLDHCESRAIAADLPDDWPERLQANRPEDLPT